MHCFPVGAALQDDGNLPSGVFLGGSLPPQLAELALATKASAIAQAITSGRIPPRTRRKLQAAEDGRRSRSRRACSVMTPHIGPRLRGHYYGVTPPAALAWKARGGYGRARVGTSAP